jgi:hypothetical protein
MMRSLLAALIINCFIAAVALGEAPEKVADSPQIAAVTVHSTMNELNDFRPGYIYLIVKNQSDSLLTIRRIDLAEHASFIKARPTFYGSNFLSEFDKTLIYPDKKIIKPGTSEVYGINIKASDQVIPGKHLLVFNVFYDGWSKGKHKDGSLTATHEFQVNAFGEHEILGALQNAVSFLMVPGFIIIIVAGLILAWTPFIPPQLKEKVPEWTKGDKITDLRFWVIAITFSLFMARWLYPFLTKHFTSYGKRDYLYGYGFSDMVMMWWFSVITGILLAFLMYLIWLLSKGIHWLYKEITYRLSYSERDDPETLLNKAIKKGMTDSWLKQVKVLSTGKKAFLIETDSHTKDALWMIPYVKVLWQIDALDQYELFNEKIAKEATPLPILLDYLQNNRKGKGLVSIEWAKKGGVDNPQKVKKGELDMEHMEQSTASIFYPTLNT